MTPHHSDQPRIAAVIPTYNRSAFLRATLAALARQRMPASQFEVVVSDDGSSDDTRETVASFEDRLWLRYRFQLDLGWRANMARNAGARLATAPVLVFVDTGVLPGPDFLSTHLSAQTSTARTAVLGYTFGYRPDLEIDLPDWERPPEDLVRDYAGTSWFTDVRHFAFERFGFDLANCAVPWQWFWSMNCSMHAADFWAAGGFDEDFRSWGGEDLELGYRLFRGGLRFAVSQDAWAIEAPHARATVSNLESNIANTLMFLRKHPVPMVELLWAFFARERTAFRIEHDWNVEDEHLLVQAAVTAARTVDVTGELVQLRELAGRARIAVFGCGNDVPGWLASAALFDFDPDIVHASEHEMGHAIGIRTTLADHSVDVVFVTSRLRSLWDRWADAILAEAARIGRQVRGPLASAATPVARQY